jgi:hypothetical protein
MSDITHITPDAFSNLPVDSPSEFAQTMVDALLAGMANQSAPGVVSVTIDGISTTYSWTQAKDQLQFWERRASKSAGKRRMVVTLDLRNG